MSRIYCHRIYWWRENQKIVKNFLIPDYYHLLLYIYPTIVSFKIIMQIWRFHIATNITCSSSNCNFNLDLILGVRNRTTKWGDVNTKTEFMLDRGGYNVSYSLLTFIVTDFGLYILVAALVEFRSIEVTTSRSLNFCFRNIDSRWEFILKCLKLSKTNIL